MKMRELWPCLGVRCRVKVISASEGELLAGVVLQGSTCPEEIADRTVSVIGISMFGFEIVLE